VQTRVAAAFNFDGFGAGRGARVSGGSGRDVRPAPVARPSIGRLPALLRAAFRGGPDPRSHAVDPLAAIGPTAR